MNGDKKLVGSPLRPKADDKLVLRGHIRGSVRGFQSRTETHPQPFKKQPRTWTIWTFRVERLDEHGKRLELVPVELRGLRFEGGLNEGDEVDVRRESFGDATLRPRSVRNVTTGATIVVKGESALDIVLQVGAGIVLIFLAMLCIGTAFIGISSAGEAGSSRPQDTHAVQQEQCVAWGDPSPLPSRCKYGSSNQ